MFLIFIPLLNAYSLVDKAQTYPCPLFASHLHSRKQGDDFLMPGHSGIPHLSDLAIALSSVGTN